MSNQRITYDISWTALLKLIVLAVGVWAVITLHEVLILMLVVFIFVAAVNPTILQLQRYMSRTFAVALFFTLLLLAVGVSISLFVPLIIRQLSELAVTYPHLLDSLRPYLSEVQATQVAGLVSKANEAVASAVTSLSGDALAKGASLLGGLVTFLTFLVISFYLLLEEKNAKDFFHSVLPRDRFDAVYVTVQKISEKMGYWIRGQLILMAIIGAANFVVFSLVGVPSPLPLALWAGLTEAIPYIGPFIGILPAVLVLLVSGEIIRAVIVLVIGFVVIQQLESSFIAPKVMGHAVGLSPVFVILAIIVGAKIFGVVGAIIAVPAAAIISVVVEEWPQLRKVWRQQRGKA